LIYKKVSIYFLSYLKVKVGFVRSETIFPYWRCMAQIECGLNSMWRKTAISRLTCKQLRIFTKIKKHFVNCGDFIFSLQYLN
jgi:hypothetical protein